MTTAEMEIKREAPPVPALLGVSGRESWRWSTALSLVLVAFALRISFMMALGTYGFDRGYRIDDSCISGETTNIAASIATGHGFRSAFNGDDTGPTAWIAPAYPYFVALVFRFFGVLTRGSIIFLFAIQSLFSALTVLPILGISTHTVGRRTGLWAAWTWALFPWFAKWSVTWLWDTSLSALLLSLLFWFALHLTKTPSRKAWVAFGALWGIASLLNPSLMAFLPISMAWCAFEAHRRRQNWLQPLLTSLLACLMVISPWLVRNRVVFGRWVFLRSNFGFEFALGNYHGSLGRGWGGTHPSGNRKEFDEYRKVGEIAYVQERQEKALRFVKQFPWEFTSLTARRVGYFWDGSAMKYSTPIPWYWAPSSFGAVSFLLLPALLIAHRRSLRAWPMFFGALLVYPVPYYLTFSQVRYRHPIEPLMLVLIAYAGVTAAEWIAALCGGSSILETRRAVRR